MSGRQKDVGSIHLHQIDGGIETVGLATSHANELVVRAAPHQIDEARALLEWTVSYIRGSGRGIAPGETMAVGSSLVRFTDVRPSVIELWEFDAEADDFLAGVDRALTVWRDQHEVCRSAMAAFEPPPPHAKVVVSDGVLEGDPAEGVRYHAPEHMSGWWVTTDRFDGNMKGLRGEHVLRVCAARPTLARYLALPPGYRFDTRIDQVWPDESVASDGDLGSKGDL